MRKLWIIIPLSIAVVAVAIISFSIALAQGIEGSDSNASKLATKVAGILGLDTAVVDDAIKQAREELRDEATQKKLDALVEKGRLTKKQADEYLNWIQSKPEAIPAIGKRFFGKRGYHSGWKSHGGVFGYRDYFNGEPSLEDIQKKLNAMVEYGVITQEEGEAKLKAIQAIKVD